MKRLILVFILMLMVAPLAIAKGGGGHGGGHSSAHASGIAHATVASHIPAHGSSHQNTQANVGEPLSNADQITIAATIILAFIFGITAIIWSGE